MKITKVLCLAALLGVICAAGSAAMSDKDGELLNAALTGNKANVEKYLRRGAFINAKGGNSKTALILAIENDHPDVAELLILKGANVNFADNDGMTPLMFAAQKGQESVVKLLLSKKANPNIQQSNIKSVYATANMTALMFAVESGKPGIVRMLIAAGANVNKKNRDGKTALVIA